MVEGGPLSFADLVAVRAPALLRLAVMLTGRADGAEDLLQSTLLRAVRHGDRIAGMAAPAAYLRQIMVNEHLSRGRHRRRVSQVPVAGAGASAASPDTSAVDDRDEAWRLLATLTARQRAVLVLRFYEDLPDAQIAGLLGCAEATVRSHALRGLATLRDHLSGLTKELDQ